jgi:hypothetical protein
MSTESKAVIRCAIYTRKSSEEGLEQSFNSLDAQREACARPSSPVNDTKAGEYFRPSTTMEVIPEGIWSGLR